MLNVSHLSKEYPGPAGALAVLSDVSFSLEPGDAAAIITLFPYTTLFRSRKSVV